MALKQLIRSNDFKVMVFRKCMSLMQVITILICCGLFGCATEHPTTLSSKNLSQIETPTQEQIEQAKKRLHMLKPDMTDKQIHSVLGLKESWFFAETGSGPTSNFWTREYIRGGHKLFITTDVTRQKEASGKITSKFTLLNVSLDDATWTANETPQH